MFHYANMTSLVEHIGKKSVAGSISAIRPVNEAGGGVMYVYKTGFYFKVIKFDYTTAEQSADNLECSRVVADCHIAFRKLFPCSYFCIKHSTRLPSKLSGWKCEFFRRFFFKFESPSTQKRFCVNNVFCQHFAGPRVFEEVQRLLSTLVMLAFIKFRLFVEVPLVLPLGNTFEVPQRLN